MHLYNYGRQVGWWDTFGAQRQKHLTEVVLQNVPLQPGTKPSPQ